MKKKLVSALMCATMAVTMLAGICFYGYIVSDGGMECNPLAIACA